MKKAEERRTHTSHFLPRRRTIQGGVSIFGRVEALAKAARLGRSWRDPVTAYCVSVSSTGTSNLPCSEVERKQYFLN